MSCVWFAYNLTQLQKKGLLFLVHTEPSRQVIDPSNTEKLNFAPGLARKHRSTVAWTWELPGKL